MLTHAWITGRSHYLMRKNGHDFATGLEEPAGCASGLVLDGCGSKYRDTQGRYTPHNEIGAKLLGRFLANWLTTHLSADTALPALVDALPDVAMDFFSTLVNALDFSNEAGRTRFVATHLLTTVLGFLLTPSSAVFFWSGDGYLCINGKVTTLEGDNRPDYLAYALLDQSRPAIQHQLLPREDITWLAVATDGWTPALLSALDPTMDNLALQRWMNVQAQQAGHFEDDGAIALCNPFMMKVSASS